MGYKSYSYEDYERAMKMFKKGIGITTVSKTLGIPKSTLHYWRKGIHKPPTLRWTPNPSKELAYVLGVLQGAAKLRIHTDHHDIRLQSKDDRFVDKFSRKLAKILDKKYMKPRWAKGKNIWEVEYTSKAFYMWYKKQSLNSLKQYIEYTKETVIEFLMGIYDSNGEIYQDKKIVLYHSNVELLHYVKYLLEQYLKIKCEEPHRSTKRDRYKITIIERIDTQIFLKEIMK